jgi:hypothetical protein
MSYDDKTAGDIAGEKLEAELATAKPGAFNRFKVNVSDLAYRCTFGKVGTAKPTPSCPYTK